EAIFSEPVAAAAITAIAADKLKTTIARPGRVPAAREAETRP
ncbi:glycosyltransferase family 1 protein, partial [Mesorhizobium sp. M7A.F.Ca.MR.228.00.0.0]